MTVSELIEQLLELNPNAEVRIAYQPSYPLWGMAVGAVPASAVEEGDTDPAVDEVVYTATSDARTGYADPNLWFAAEKGW